ncbi:MAG: hypothetical protein GY838_12640 [bacterium]|nr:hypothetical protein [bacterium]
MIDQLVADYIAHLEQVHPQLAKTFRRELRTQAEARRAEAVIFHVLDVLGMQPFVSEKPSTGGPDFGASADGVDLDVEVASVGADTVGRNSDFQLDRVTIPRQSRGPSR